MLQPEQPCLQGPGLLPGPVLGQALAAHTPGNATADCKLTTFGPCYAHSYKLYLAPQHACFMCTYWGSHQAGLLNNYALGCYLRMTVDAAVAAYVTIH